MTTADFISSQAYSYIITYSLNRGEKLTQLKAVASALFKEGRKSLLTASAPELPAIRTQLRNLERLWGLDLMPLTDSASAFQITASPVAKIKSDSTDAEQIRRFLQQPVVNRFHWMCGPLYRDALGFYDDQNNLLGVLNICFGCDLMLTDKGEEVDADASTYRELKYLLTHLGHDISEE